MNLFDLGFETFTTKTRKNAQCACFTGDFLAKQAICCGYFCYGQTINPEPE